MRWLTARVANVSAFIWIASFTGIICSGCLSLEPGPTNTTVVEDTDSSRASALIDQYLSFLDHILPARERVFSSHLLAIRGGAEDSHSPPYSNERDTTKDEAAFSNDLEDVNGTTTETLEENKHVSNHVITYDPSASEQDTLSQKVSNKLKQWKERSTSKQDFLDRMALVSGTLLRREHDAVLDKELEDRDGITPQSDLTRKGRYFTIVTTAALPWMTGTSVNPLLRAAHLVRKTRTINHDDRQWVTLVVPWLELEEDQQELYHRVFENEGGQEEYMRTWLRREADMPDVADPQTGLKIRFYPARYHPGLKSIFAMGDMCALIPREESDVCILEEPEHLNWYRAPGEGWTTKFHYVVGIVHTNYKEYASAHYSGLWTAPAIAVMSSAMVRAYCHKVIKLSDVLQTFAPEKEETSNVHGVRSEFLKEGMRRAQQTRAGDSEGVLKVQDEEKKDETKAYFIGKLLWAKGLDLMLELEKYYRQCTGDYFPIDIYGSGPQENAIIRSYHGRKLANGNGKQATNDVVEASTTEEDPSEWGATTRQRLQKIKNTIKATTESLEFELPRTLSELRRHPIPATFPGRVDHALLTEQYTIFVNPSVSEVLCTTTAEALAMGKFAIIPVHPSNTFFLRFPNCLAYRNKFEFVANLRWALTHDPEPLTPELEREFTWEAATDRLIEAAAITHEEALEREKLGRSKLDERIAWFHNELGKGVTGDALRKVLGAGPASHQVKYQVAQQSIWLDDEFEESDDESPGESEDEDEGLPKKLRMSSFASALRSTVTNGLPSLKIGSS